MIKYQNEDNWANRLNETRLKYNLDLNDHNIKAMSKYQWKPFAKERINKCAFETLAYQCQNHAKSKDLKYDKLSQQSYFTYLGPAAARIIFRARTRMLDMLECPFFRECDENSDHIFSCPEGRICHINDKIHDISVNIESNRLMKSTS